MINKLAESSRPLRQVCDWRNFNGSQYKPRPPEWGKIWPEWRLRASPMCPPCSTGPTLLPSSSLTPPSLLFLINNFSYIQLYHFDSLWFDPQDFHLFFPLSRDLSWFLAFTQFWIILVLFRRQDHSNQNAKSLQNLLLQLFWPICKTEDICAWKNWFTWICPEIGGPDISSLERTALLLQESFAWVRTSFQRCFG